MGDILQFRSKSADAAFCFIERSSTRPKRGWIPTRECACEGYECRFHDPLTRPWCPAIPDRDNPPAGTVQLWSHL